MHYSTLEVFAMIHFICEKYLSSSQFDVKIEEEEANYENTPSTVSMNHFILKMLATIMFDKGVKLTEIASAVEYLGLHDGILPNGKSLSVIANIPIRISDGKSKIPAER